MKRVLSGIQATGDPTLGNYLGAIKHWVDMQPEPGSDDEQFYFIPNLHTLNVRPDPQTLRQNTLNTVAWLIAAGLDPERVTLFVQSQIPAHSELAWVFSNYVTMGELSRMTQYKDKSKKAGERGQLVGIFTYPTLMAADILLYDPDEVPVGDDQRQHVELTRDIAERFNNLYGPIFKLPVAGVPEVGARIMNLQDPTAKMSKSDDDHSGNIMLTDSAEVIRQKVKRAVTDSGSEIKAADDKPAITNLLVILAVTTGRDLEELEAEYTSKSYGEFKSDVAEAIVQQLEPIQKRHAELLKSADHLLKTLESGRERADRIASAKLSQVKQALGLL